MLHINTLNLGKKNCPSKGQVVFMLRHANLRREPRQI